MVAHVIGVYAQKGGVGRSLVAANLALTFQERLKKDSLLFLCKAPYAGDGLLALGEKNAPSAVDLEDHLDRGKEAWLSKIARHRQTGLFVLPLCLEVEQAVRATHQVVSQSIRLASESVDIVVIDLDVACPDVLSAAIDHCTEMLLITTPDLLCLNQSLKAIDYLQAHYFPRDSILLVVNQLRETSPIRLSFIEHNLKLRASAVLPMEAALVESSLNRGQPLATTNPRHTISRSLFNLAEAISRRPVTRHAVVLKRPTRSAAKISASEVTSFGIPLPELIALKQKIHRKLIEEMNLKQMDYETMVNPDKRLELYRATEFVISRILDKDAAWITSRDDRVQLVREILNEALGLGPIEYLLADDAVSEIMVNGARRVFVERKGQIELTPFYFTDEPQLRRVIERIVVRVGRRIDEKSPMVDARLPDGSRVNAIIPPLAIGGSALTIRKFSKFPLTSETLLKLGSLNLQMAKFLHACVLARKNTIISGGSGSGKTTLLNILSGTIPPNERIITIEDSAELQLPQVNVVRLETRPANVEGEGAVSIRDLVRNALRMRPDRIVVGECRGAESMDMLQAMNTGHDGSLTTVHANSPGDALSRLETMCLMAGLDLPARAIRKQIASAVQIIVQQTRLSDGSRKITQVTEVCGMEGDVTTMQDIFRFRQDRVLRDGPVEGQFEATGNIPTFLDLLRPKGIELPREVFLRQR